MRSASPTKTRLMSPAEALAKAATEPERRDERIARQVEALGGFGLPIRHIARIAGLSGEAMHEHYQDDIELGVAKANAKIIEALFRKAMGEGPGATAAAIFWAKARCGWKEVNDVRLDFSVSNEEMAAAAAAYDDELLSARRLLILEAATRVSEARGDDDD